MASRGKEETQAALASIMLKILVDEDTSLDVRYGTASLSARAVDLTEDELEVVLEVRLGHATGQGIQ